jgi:predicted Zn-dependent protease
LKFSRGFEEEADYLGLQYMYKTDYDPQSFMSFFEKMQAREKVTRMQTFTRQLIAWPTRPEGVSAAVLSAERVVGGT